MTTRVTIKSEGPIPIIVTTLTHGAAVAAPATAGPGITIPVGTMLEFFVHSGQSLHVMEQP